MSRRQTVSRRLEAAGISGGGCAGPDGEVGDDRGMVAARRNATFVRIVDLDDAEVTADPDRVESPSGARRCPPLTRAVRDPKGTVWVRFEEFRNLSGTVDEPPTQGVIEVMNLSRTDQDVVAGCTMQTPVA